MAKSNKRYRPTKPTLESCDTPAGQNKAAFMHEAGHAVISNALGLSVSEVQCHGGVGFCKANMKAEDDAAARQAFADEAAGKITKDELYLRVLKAHWARLVALLGGIAGESLILGRAAYTNRRAADDVTSFFGLVASISRHMPASQFDPLWLDAFQKAQDQAWYIVQQRRVSVEAVARALEAKQKLDSQGLEAVLYAAQQSIGK